MLNLKKTAVAVLAFGSSAVFAGTMGPVCQPGNVTIPCEKQAWDLGIQALYLQPTYSGQNAYIGSVANGNNVTFHEIDPDWQWGFKLEGSYHFNTGNDLNLNWYHLGSKSTQRTYTGNFSFDGADNATTETYRVKPRWDAVNLEFGQHVDFDEVKNMRLHGGVQYARIKTEERFSGVTGATSYTVDHEASYNGFGPRAGVDLTYGFGNGLAVYAKPAAAVLVGSSKSSESLVDNTGALYQGNINNASKTVLVPELEAKLGATYTYAMAQGDLSLDVGYMWQNYFNANQIGLTPAAGPVDADFGVNGLYFGLKWVGSVV